MSRRDEVNRSVAQFALFDTYSKEQTHALINACQKLADEIDDLRGKLDDVRRGIGCARGQRTTQFCAEAAARSDQITRLLELLKPLPAEKYQKLRYAEDIDHEDCCRELYARACEIAGRAPTP